MGRSPAYNVSRETLAERGPQFACDVSRETSWYNIARCHSAWLNSNQGKPPFLHHIGRFEAFHVKHLVQSLRDFPDLSRTRLAAVT